MIKEPNIRVCEKEKDGYNIDITRGEQKNPGKERESKPKKYFIKR